MSYSDKELRNAIAEKDEKVIAGFVIDVAEEKIAMFNLDEESKTKAIEKAVADTLRGYQKFPHKKQWIKAYSYLYQIVTSSLANSVWKK